MKSDEIDRLEDLNQEMEIEAIDLGALDALEEDIVPCSCCGISCTC